MSLENFNASADTPKQHEDVSQIHGLESGKAAIIEHLQKAIDEAKNDKLSGIMIIKLVEEDDRSPIGPLSTELITLVPLDNLPDLLMALGVAGNKVTDSITEAVKNNQIGPAALLRLMMAAAKQSKVRSN